MRHGQRIIKYRIRDINHYSDDEQKRMSALFARFIGLTTCIHKLSISECPMMRYRENSKILTFEGSSIQRNLIVTKEPKAVDARFIGQCCIQD